MEEVVRDDLSDLFSKSVPPNDRNDHLLVDAILWFALLQEPQSFCQVVIQNHGLVSELSYEKVLFFDLFLKRYHSLKLLLQRL